MLNKFPSIALLFAAVAVVGLPVMANAKNSTDKVTGSVAANNGSTTAEISLSVSGGFSSTMMSSELQQGAYAYSNSDGLAYSIDVRFAQFVDNAVWFTGPVVTSTDASLMNQWLVVSAHDNGQSAGAPDVINSRFATSPMAAFNMTVFLNKYLYDHYEVTGGNIKVH